MTGRQRARCCLATGHETYRIEGVADAIAHGKHATVRAFGVDGNETKFDVAIRIDTPQEAEYYRNGGILPYVLRQIAAPVAAAVK